jgi:hypothetical protein
LAIPDLNLIEQEKQAAVRIASRPRNWAARSEPSGGCAGRRRARTPNTKASAGHATTTTTIARALSCGSRPIREGLGKVYGVDLVIGEETLRGSTIRN